MCCTRIRAKNNELIGNYQSVKTMLIEHRVYQCAALACLRGRTEDGFRAGVQYEESGVRDGRFSKIVCAGVCQEEVVKMTFGSAKLARFWRGSGFRVETAVWHSLKSPPGCIVVLLQN